MEPEFDDFVSVEELMALERRWAGQRRGGAVSPRCQLEYGGGLVRSRYGNDVSRGVTLLQELVPQGPGEGQQELSFYLALGNYRLKEYERALAQVGRFLAAEPESPRGLRLQQQIRHHMRRDGLLGAAIVGGVALGVAGLAGLLGLAISRARH
ncbi:mitochondrial fission 1 protein [Athene noctua]|uniref:mitochondrial fission 1 protein n=1 Tax=Athene noctua TaxID=126797 RepID=UPI003EBDF3FC